MSNTWLRLVPADPRFQPAPSGGDEAARLLREFLPAGREVTLEFSDAPVFYDPGGNWGGVACPKCGADAEDWWGDAMDAAFENRFAELSLSAPCCGARVSLNDLRYGWPAAFGRFALSAMNADVPGLPAELRTALEAALGSPLREVWCRI